MELLCLNNALFWDVVTLAFQVGSCGAFSSACLWEARRWEPASWLHGFGPNPNRDAVGPSRRWQLLLDLNVFELLGSKGLEEASRRGRRSSGSLGPAELQ